MIVGAESPILILDLKTPAVVTSRVLVTSNESQIIENKFRVNIHSCGNHYQIIYSNLLIIVSVHLRFFFMEMLKKRTHFKINKISTHKFKCKHTNMPSIYYCMHTHIHRDRFTNGLCSANKVQILTTLHTKLSSILASKVNHHPGSSSWASQRPTVVIT